MTSLAASFVTFGALLLLGLLTDVLGRRTPLPRVTLLLLFGILIGPTGADLIPPTVSELFPAITDFALLMVGFLLGEKLTRKAFYAQGHAAIVISIAAVLTTAALVVVGLVAIGVPLAMALLLGGIATATAPAATFDVVEESGTRGPFTDTLLGIVALDDAWGLLIFSLLLAAAQAVSGQGGGLDLASSGVRDVGGAILLGFGLGVPTAYFTGRVRPGEPSLVEALGVVLLTGGIALWMEVSFLLAAMVLGMTVANIATHHERPFHAIDGIHWPFLILFFVLAGASLELHAITQVGSLGAAYISLRFIGRLAGGWIGGRACGAPAVIRRWMGPALLPQAGVAIGMALVAAERFPDRREEILAVVIGATVVFELTGPVLTRRALTAAGELNRSKAEKLSADTSQLS